MKKNKKKLQKKKPKGNKFDQGKSPVHLIPIEAILGMGYGFDYGAKKYGKYNFRDGIEYTRIIDSLIRHTLAFLSGEEIDEESQKYHVDLIGCNFAMLKYMTVHKKDMDDRYKKEKCATKSKKVKP